MKTRRKPRQRFLPLNMDTIANPMPYENAKQAFTRMFATLEAPVAAGGKLSAK